MSLLIKPKLRQLDLFGWARSRGLLPSSDISLTTKYLK